MDVSRHSEPKKNFSHQDISDCGGSVIDKRKGLNPLGKVIAYNDYTDVPSVVISRKLRISNAIRSIGWPMGSWWSCDLWGLGWRFWSWPLLHCLHQRIKYFFIPGHQNRLRVLAVVRVIPRCPPVHLAGRKSNICSRIACGATSRLEVLPPMTTLWYRMWLMSSSCSKLNQNVRIAVPSIRMSIHCVFCSILHPTYDLSYNGILSLPCSHLLIRPRLNPSPRGRVCIKIHHMNLMTWTAYVFYTVHRLLSVTVAALMTWPSLQAISISVLHPRTILNLKVVLTEDLQLSPKLSFWVSETHEPL